MKRTPLFLASMTALLYLAAGCSDSNTASAKNFKVLGSNLKTAAAGKLAASRAVTSGQGTPTSFKVTLFEIWVSTSADCSAPTQIADFGTDGQEFDLNTNPTIIDTHVEPGTYPCMITRSFDTMKFKSDATAAAAFPTECGDTTKEYQFDVYRADETGQWIDLSGNPIPATGTPGTPGPDKVFTYASTETDATKVLAGGVAVNEHQLTHLTGALVVPGETTFYMDATDSINTISDGGPSFCWLNKIDNGFR